MSRSAGRLANVSAALLVGGASSRMGRDKSRLTLLGVANATRIAGVLERLFEDVLLVGGDPPESAFGRRIPDRAGPRCALRGVVSALEAAREERVLLLATDVPLVTPDLLLALVAWPQADALVVRDGHGRQPLCGVYRRTEALRLARERLAAEQLPLSGWLDALGARELPADVLAAIDPGGTALLDLNTPEDLARAETLLSGRG